ncbi:protein daughter of sevenless [Topomyia yanbarensis]|uniref:protein daughter of sevenless n=1 Tax=Topomyia yanbarensis TaxID=2498891 RepID=UPI00273C036F|nr:protein daughter of sevenless [Topomyia yanbarensis]
MTTNKEVYHEGWLIKSPPTKRIWRARWRRRWFTLKQGELPGQFFLEYYTDRKCRKLKGIIDLDQCEQVDAGLRLDRQKEKYAHMFDVKTPTRTYYLAADTEDDMRGWVNCICQVCNLQETQTADEQRPYYNIGAINMADAVNMADQVNVIAPTVNSSATEQQDISNETEISLLHHSMQGDPQEHSIQQVQPQPRQSLTTVYNPYGTYQNEEAMNFRGSEYTNRETIICEAKLSQSQTFRNNHMDGLMNAATIERSQSLRGKPSSPEKGTAGHATMVNHTRTQSLSTDNTIVSSAAAASAGKKIPENLKLNERTLGYKNGSEQPSPALSNSSGPYIPISECFSGSPMLHSPITPLNSLDPRFYDTPRSHTNIGFNLINNEQPYSPKRNNVSGTVQPNSTTCAKPPRSGKSSPSDSESVFTDDEWTAPATEGTGARDRNTRPSDSSIENDAIGWTYVQRFAKVSQDDQKVGGVVAAPPRPPKRTSLILDSIEKHKDIQSSDTENASPAIGPKDASSCVEQFYDIPRSHQPGQYTGSSMHLSDAEILSPLNQCDLVASSTPNLASEVSSLHGTLGRIRPHCYSNAAPQRVEGNVFRFDFSEQGDAPAINRNLKPKSSADITKSIESISLSTKQGNLREGGFNAPATPATLKNPPPSVDRTRKPATPQIGTNSMRRKGGPVSLNLQNHSENVYGNTQEHGTQLISGISPRTPGKNEDRLQYLDLDHSNSPQKTPGLAAAYGGGAVGITAPHQLGNNSASTSNVGNHSLAPPVVARTPYTTVDFVKTDAFNRIRADTEMSRNQSRVKDQS